jgi:hypothetical protein
MDDSFRLGARTELTLTTPVTYTDEVTASLNAM